MHSRSSWNSNILSQKNNLRLRTLLILPHSREEQNSDLQNPWKHQAGMLTACNSSKFILTRDLSYCWALSFMERSTSLNKVEEPLRKIPYGIFRLSHRWTHNHTGKHTYKCICPCTTYKHENTHAHHTHPKMGKSHRNYVKNRKQSFQWQIPCLFVLWRVCQGIACLSFILLSVSVHVCKWLCVSIF